MKTEDPKPVRALATTPGSAEIRSNKLVLLYTIKWKSAVISGTGTDAFQSSLKEVTGTIYKDGKPTTDYSADTGFVDKSKGLLTADGHVRIKALPSSQKSVAGMAVKSDHMSYREGDEIIRAAGGVSLNRNDLEAGPFEEVWCSSDLNQVATPDSYQSPSHNKKSF